MIKKNIVNLESLHCMFNDLPGEVKNDRVSSSISLGIKVVRQFLGKGWVTKYVISDRHIKGFFSIDDSDKDLSQERSAKSLFRIVDLAEVLYNLQNTSGFDECITKMRDGNLESTYAELDLGRLLYIHSVPFQYIMSRGVKGLDYDVEIFYSDGTTACAEVKCKIEGTQFSEKGIMNMFKLAKKQLPENKPGILFVKLPSNWKKESDFGIAIRRIAEDFLRQTTRIVSVKYYVSTLDFEKNFMRHNHDFDEINNPNNKFDKMRDWKIFSKVYVKPGWNGMPPHWQRILFFPGNLE